ncbi:MAG TPA: hybrid sensor histidine kinase/response regulator [Bacteroides sp.]|nr:hybrid sensor histidine kinase/response regulator [Bacteroides sp.]
MRYMGLLVWMLFLTLPLFGDQKDYFFEQISTDEGFSYNAIKTIVEDKHGFVWFGSNNGLYFYNTARVTKYTFDPMKDDSPPSNVINKLYKDGFDRIWICTENGVCYFNEQSDSFVRLKLIESSDYLNSPAVSSIVQYSDTNYLIVINGRLHAFNINDLVLKKVSIGDEKAEISYLGKNEKHNIYVGTSAGQLFVNTTSISDFELIYSSKSGSVRTLGFINNNLWIALADHGIEVISTDGVLQTRYREEYTGVHHIPHNSVRKIIQRKNGEIWIGTYNGIAIITPSGNQVIKHDPYNGLPHNSIYELYIGKNDGVWVGTWSGGLAYYSDYNYKFPHIRIIKDNVPISNSVIASFTEDSDGTIWVGSETNGILSFDPEKKIPVKSTVNGDRWPIARIKSLCTDKQGKRWIGTFQEGLWYREDNRIRMAGSELNRCIISSLCPVDSGIWVGTREQGLKFYHTKEGTVEDYFAEEDKIGSISSNGIWDIFQDSKNNIWICSDFGLTVKYQHESHFTRYYNNENANSLSRNFTYTITEDQNGKIWIGTNGGGIDIFDPENQTFREFRLNAAIQNADVYSIIIDLQENIWFSSNQGIYVYNTKNGTLQQFTEQDDLLGARFRPNSGFIHSSGKLFFGGANGFNMIDPTVVKENPIVPDVYLSDLLINNQTINNFKTRYVNTESPAEIERLELTYNQNSLSFEFAANNFIKSAENRFRYRMINYLDEWIEIEQGNDVSFTKIPPGKYTMQLLASNNDGLWSKTPKEIQLIIHPPFWRTWYAYCFYSISFSMILIFVLRARRRIISERYKHAADEFLFSEKVKFFTNVSHEFRTPLTLILSPLDRLIKEHRHAPATTDHLKVIKRNADRLLCLTNQMLDFRLIELNKVRLQIENCDIVSLCKDVYDCFEYQISEKQINCIFTSPYKSLVLPLDPEKIKKAIFNILSNALKYSHEKGQIILSLEQKTVVEDSYSDVFCVGKKFSGESLEIKVKDNGKGINAEVLPHIFDRFVFDNKNDQTGTGIGLHICQEYIQLHQGNILVTSETGKGATFAINIPVTSDIDITEETTIIQYHFDQIQEEEGVMSIDVKPTHKNKIILFAEDNDELRIYYKNILSSAYRVLSAKNGQQAFEIAREVIPDLIISDIMMPGIGGLELIDKIRETKKTKHIPIILLTALGDDKSKIESMQKGADDFITKPVKEEYLFAKIKNIFSKIEELKQQYEAQGNEAVLTSLGKESFVEKAEKIVIENLQNPNFDIEEFASVLNLSRSSFHRKLKAAINLGPSEFVRDIRLKKAVELIKKGDLNMDEVGFLVGFNSQSYFIRSFKAKYGKTPTAFKADLPD